MLTVEKINFKINTAAATATGNNYCVGFISHIFNITTTNKNQAPKKKQLQNAQ